jgi:hypothetical protein
MPGDMHEPPPYPARSLEWEFDVCRCSCHSLPVVVDGSDQQWCGVCEDMHQLEEL